MAGRLEARAWPAVNLIAAALVIIVAGGAAFVVPRHKPVPEFEYVPPADVLEAPAAVRDSASADERHLKQVEIQVKESAVQSERINRKLDALLKAQRSTDDGATQ